MICSKILDWNFGFKKSEKKKDKEKYLTVFENVSIPQSLKHSDRDLNCTALSK